MFVILFLWSLAIERVRNGARLVRTPHSDPDRRRNQQALELVSRIVVVKAGKSLK